MSASAVTNRREDDMATGLRNVLDTQGHFDCMRYRGGDSYQKVGGLIARCRRQCIEVHSIDQSARSVEIFFAFIFHLSGWALVAPSCFVLQVRDASPQETR